LFKDKQNANGGTVELLTTNFSNVKSFMK